MSYKLDCLTESRHMESLDDIETLVRQKHAEFLACQSPTYVEAYVANHYGVAIGLGHPRGSVLTFNRAANLTEHWISDGGSPDESSIWFRYGNQASEVPACTLLPTERAIEGLIDSLRRGQPSPLVNWERC